MSASRGGLLRSVGPGAIVAAAFIGPGTVTTATLAGANYGFVLLWALTFSIIATLVLQEMAARLGLVTGDGLGEAIRARFNPGVRRMIAVVLVISAIAFGNAAYETGNLLGASLGLAGIAGGDVRFYAVVFGAIAFALLWTGHYRAIEGFMVAMVVLMSVVFLVTSITLRPDVGELLRGMFVPRIPSDGRGLVLAVGLIGTTVVPYNLFLHAATVREKWETVDGLRAARLDLVLAIVLGGVVSMAIVATSAAALAGTDAEIASATDMATQLEPLLGSWARIFFAVGLLAAGFTSTITAPLAAAYATAGAMGWPRDMRAPRFRAVWMLVLCSGIAFAAAGVRPVPAILFAQVANGVLLPAVAIFLLLAVNDRVRMRDRANGVLANVLGGLIVLVTLFLGAWAVYRAVTG
jgi:NRAMP (natural resistance-associated macrophage protein)-like metal ion transporter